MATALPAGGHSPRARYVYERPCVGHASRAFLISDLSAQKGRSFGKHIETESISRRKSWAIRNIHIVIRRKCAEEERESILHKVGRAFCRLGKLRAYLASPPDQVSEYLFDLFDANCMDEYHTLDRFESQAICITSRR